MSANLELSSGTLLQWHQTVQRLTEKCDTNPSQRLMHGITIFCSPDGGTFLRSQQPKTLQRICSVCGDETNRSKPLYCPFFKRRIFEKFVASPARYCAECPCHSNWPYALLGFAVELNRKHRFFPCDGDGIVRAHVLAASEFFVDQLEQELAGYDFPPPWIYQPTGDPWVGWSDHGERGTYRNAWQRFQKRLNGNQFAAYLDRWSAPEKWRNAFINEASSWFIQ